LAATEKAGQRRSATEKASASEAMEPSAQMQERLEKEMGVPTGFLGTSGHAPTKQAALVPTTKRPIL